MNQESRSPTLTEIAAMAGCSVSTVSKALSGAPDVASHTREKVRRIAASAGYKSRSKSAAARSFHSLTMAFESYGSIYSNELLAGALAQTTTSDYRSEVTILPERIDGPGEASRWVEETMANGSRGALLVTGKISGELVRTAQNERFPLVAIDPKHRTNHEITSIGATNWAGGFAATEHLLNLGHTNIGFAGLDMEADYAVERFAGFRSALEKYGHALKANLVYYGSTDYGFGRRVGERILRAKVRPTAVVCVADTAAFGVIEAVRQGGLTVPDDLSVTGFDDIPPARWMSPELTTIRQPLRQMGGLGIRTLIRLIEGKPADSQKVQLATTLITRSSTGPVPR